MISNAHLSVRLKPGQFLSVIILLPSSFPVNLQKPMISRFLPLLFTLSFSFNSFAQITVGPSEFYKVGQVSPFRIAYLWNGNPGPAGNNVVYNFLNAYIASKDTIRYWDMQASAFSPHVPGSQIYRDLGGNPRFLSAYTKDANALWQSATIVIGNFGAGWDTLYGINDLAGRDTILSNAYQYGHVETEHSKVDIPVIPGVFARFRTKRDIQVDGAGLLYTPMGSFDSVLRVNIWTYRADSIFVNGNLDNASYDTTHDYWFIAKGFRIPAAIIHMNQNEKIWYMELAEVPFYIYGCTDTSSLNYNPLATWDDGSCKYCDPLVFSVSADTTVCAGASVTLRVLGGNRWKWSTGDTTQSITVLADSTRTYGVYVSAQADCWKLANIKVTALQSPIADFWVDKSNATPFDTIQFINLSTDATDYLWDFDDPINGTSVLSNPKHYYGVPGIKHVKLLASNDCGSDTLSTYLFLTTGLEESIVQAINAHVFPNPGSKELKIEFSSTEASPASIAIYDISGHLLHTRFIETLAFQKVVDLSAEIVDLPTGIYAIIIEQSGMKYPLKWVKN